MRTNKRVLSVFVLVMLNVSIMASLRSLPLMAELGYTILFFFAVIAITFLIPSALVSAELATGWPKSGGIYVWVREALGDRLGFFAIWIQWIHSVAWYPVIISFIATTLAYIIAPSFETSKLFVFCTILIVFWGMTLFNYLGIKVSGIFSTIGVISGTLLPGLFIILLAITWISKGDPLQITFKSSSFLPNFADIKSYVFLTGLFLSFSGLEVSAGYAGEVIEPRKSYPRAILLSAGITFLLLTFGSLFVAYVLPAQEISLVSGVMQAFHSMLERFHISSLLPVIGIALILGALSEVNAWIIEPVKALDTTADHGNLPPFLQKRNERNVPVNLLLFQAIIVTFFSVFFLFLPTLSTSFWVLTVISAQLYLMMYFLMFISAIRLRYAKPHIPRPYRIPHPHKGIWVVAGLGSLSTLFAFVISFVPPSQLKTGTLLEYELPLIISLISMIALPLIIYQFRKPHWARK